MLKEMALLSIINGDTLKRRLKERLAIFAQLELPLHFFEAPWRDVHISSR
jgi:hypothetical protein